MDAIIFSGIPFSFPGLGGAGILGGPDVVLLRPFPASQGASFRLHHPHGVIYGHSSPNRTFFLLPLFILYGFLKAGFHIERIESL